MIFWNPKLMVDTEVFGQEKQISSRIRQNIRQEDIYGILLPQNPANLFDIIHVNELLFPYYKKKELYLVGLAKGRESAVRLVCSMIAEAYKETENPDIRGRFADCKEWKSEP